MKEKENNRNLPVQIKAHNSEDKFPGYPTYPANEDIFSKYQEEKEINPENISESKTIVGKDNIERETTINKDAPGSDLDVPGSELDDALEEVGSEDEENNYYSLGGDDHTDLDENPAG
jgi:hypothetical protein